MPTPTPVDPAGPAGGAPSAPLALRAVTVLAVIQGLATVALGAVGGLASDHTLAGVTTAVFFLAYGVLLAGCGVALWRLVRWARGPVLFAQLVWLPVAWTLRDGAMALAVPLALSALLCLLCLLTPSAIEAVDGQRYADEP